MEEPLLPQSDDAGSCQCPSKFAPKTLPVFEGYLRSEKLFHRCLLQTCSRQSMQDSQMKLMDGSSVHQNLDIL